MKTIAFNPAAGRVTVGEDSAPMPGPFVWDFTQYSDVTFVDIKHLPRPDLQGKEADLEFLSRLEGHIETLGPFFRRHGLPFETHFFYLKKPQSRLRFPTQDYQLRSA